MTYNRLIILYYRPFASGNFLANILSHNREFIPKFVLDPDIGRAFQGCLLDLTDEQLFEAQIDLLKTTLPKTKEQCIDWWKYELGCSAFWAKDFQTYYKFKNIESNSWLDNLRPEPFLLMERDKYCFIVAHNIEQYTCINQCLPGAVTIQLINDHNVVVTGAKIKSKFPKSNIPNKKVDNAIYFDINSLWDKASFFKNVQNLLEMLNVEEKTLDYTVDEYYNRYIELHS